MKEFLDIFLHINDHLSEFTKQHGTLVYLFVFTIIFCETGLVVTPFLPGDSLLFAIGAVSADPDSGLNLWMAATVITIAAILGDTANYWIGRKFGHWVVMKFPKIIKPEHLDKTHDFFNKHGGKTIIMARFVPIIRTFAPFVAGSGAMNFQRFMAYNILGAFLWVILLLPAGYFFGSIPIVKEHFELVVIGIVFISALPVMIEVLKAKFSKPHQ
jgi:membrane-associated protein